ncbi:E3 ubiquitin-protein ligase UPL7 [Platanthera guangdongensis]|uniref:HECT-type E3 ubiquitin transferase n=1 Tax=Platanthera guangdongensis TaxID=2320717 RepID=A0ABR2LTK0_9ASPA
MLPPANAFYRGLTDLIEPSWLSLFNANEFNQLLSGEKQDFDVDDLRSNTRYTGGYTEGSRPVKIFWEVVKSFTPNERCLLLKFVTSCSRSPLLGFKHLQPSFTVHKILSSGYAYKGIILLRQKVERKHRTLRCEFSLPRSQHGIRGGLSLPSARRSSTIDRYSPSSAVRSSMSARRSSAIDRSIDPLDRCLLSAGIDRQQPSSSISWCNHLCSSSSHS